MTSDIKPVFLISLPRSGSTLLQKILATSPEVTTVSEPWIALPLAYMRRSGGQISEYWHRTCALAIDDLVAEFPNGEEDFDQLCREFVLGAYKKASKNQTRYFLDKTPRYYLAADFLERLFPDAHFIYLFRHPLDVLSSVFKTWHKNSFSPRVRGSAVDLWRGPELVSRAYNQTKAKKLRIDYEELVSDPQRVIGDIERFLAIKFPDTALQDYQKIELRGRMGDPTKGRKYNGVKDASVGSWKNFVTNSYRKKFLKGYVSDLPAVVFEAFQIDRTALLAEIDGIRCGHKGALKDMLGHQQLLLSIWLQHLYPFPDSQILPRKVQTRIPLG